MRGTSRRPTAAGAGAPATEGRRRGGGGGGFGGGGGGGGRLGGDGGFGGGFGGGARRTRSPRRSAPPPPRHLDVDVAKVEHLLDRVDRAALHRLRQGLRESRLPYASFLRPPARASAPLEPCVRMAKAYARAELRLVTAQVDLLAAALGDGLIRPDAELELDLVDAAVARRRPIRQEELDLVLVDLRARGLLLDGRLRLVRAPLVLLGQRRRRVAGPADREELDRVVGERHLLDLLVVVPDRVLGLAHPLLRRDEVHDGAVVPLAVLLLEQGAHAAAHEGLIVHDGRAARRPPCRPRRSPPPPPPPLDDAGCFGVRMGVLGGGRRRRSAAALVAAAARRGHGRARRGWRAAARRARRWPRRRQLARAGRREARKVEAASSAEPNGPKLRSRPSTKRRTRRRARRCCRAGEHGRLPHVQEARRRERGAVRPHGLLRDGRAITARFLSVVGATALGGVSVVGATLFGGVCVVSLGLAFTLGIAGAGRYAWRRHRRLVLRRRRLGSTRCEG